MDIGTVAAVIGAGVAIIALVFSVRNSKGYILKNIDKKRDKIFQIDQKLARKYGPNGRYPRYYTPLDEKREKLEREIKELERKL